MAGKARMRQKQAHQGRTSRDEEAVQTDVGRELESMIDDMKTVAERYASAIESAPEQGLIGDDTDILMAAS